MGTSKARQLRRSGNPVVMTRKQDYLAGVKTGNIRNTPAASGGPMSTSPRGATRPGASGWGVGSPGAKPAMGDTPAVNPWQMPKPTGLTHTSQTYAPNYYVEWNFSTWRAVVDQCRNYGYTMPFATMVTWVYQCSPFIRSLFNTSKAWIDNIPFFCEDGKGNQYPEWTAALVGERYQRKIIQQFLLANAWGFTGINFDPWAKKMLKYPMQDVDPINGLLRQSTWNFTNGLFFNTIPNMILIQPDPSSEGFCGDMEPISRSFIAMNLNKSSWLNAGLRLAMPIITAGYPQDDARLNELGQEMNPFKIQADDILRNIKPGEGVSYPYIINDKQEVQKSIMIEFEKPGTGGKAHDIFSDFNEAEKNEIREMWLGGTLTADVGDRGSRALGEVQERKFEMFMKGPVEDVIDGLNTQYVPKMRSFFHNMPGDLVINIDRTRQKSADEIVMLSNVMNQNGLKLNKKFFVSNGLPEEFIEDAVPAGDEEEGFEQNPDAKNPAKAGNISSKDLQSARHLGALSTRIDYGGVKKKFLS
jgi:hypothetical protein